MANSPSSNFLGTCETPYGLLVQDQVGLLGCPWTLSLCRQKPGAGWSPTQSRSSQSGRGERLPREGSLELGFEGRMGGHWVEVSFYQSGNDSGPHGISVQIRKRHPYFHFTPLFQKTILTFENLPCLSYEQRVPWDCAVHNPDYCARALGEPGQKGQEVPVPPATRGTEAGLGGHLSEKVPNPQTLWIQNF